jgi:ketosteroid isomerase-like protein
MGEEAVETIAQAFTAFNRRDLPALLSVCHSDIDWIPMRAAAADRRYHGHDGVRRALDDVQEEFEELHNDPRRWVDLGDRVVIVGRFVAKERATGLRIDNPGAWMCELRDGLVVRMQVFPSEDAALEAARDRD